MDEYIILGGYEAWYGKHSRIKDGDIVTSTEPTLIPVPDTSGFMEVGMSVSGTKCDAVIPLRFLRLIR